MERIFDFLAFLFIIAIVAVIVVIVVCYFHDYTTTNDYTYVDIDGNTGVADVCSQERGLLWCKSGDRRITVKEYSLIREEEE